MDPIPISMDLRSISCKGIKSFNLFQKPSLYAVMSVADPSSPDGKRQKQKSAADPEGGENAEWEESFRFDLDVGGRGALALTLKINVMDQGNLLLLLPDRTVGKVNVPITDLLAEGSDGSVRHVSYRVLGTDGKPNGVVTFSYNLNFPVVRLPPSVCCLPPPCTLDPVVPSQADACYAPGGQGIPLPAGDYYPLPHQQSSAVPSPAADYYPPPNQQHGSAISSPAADYYPPQGQQYPPASEYYPPPRQQETVTAFPAADCRPPPRQHYPVVSSPPSDYYPPPRQQDPVLAFPAADCCPTQQRAIHSPAPAVDYYSRPRQLYPTVSIPASDCYSPARQLYPTVSIPASDYYSPARQHEPEACYPPPGTEIAYYAPPPPPPAFVAYPTPSAPPPPASCYPALGAHDGYRQQNWDHRLY